MKVWVVESDVYESRYVSGVYATIEAAIAAHPVPENYRFPETPSATDTSRPGGWKQCDDGSWDNGMDWSRAASAYEMEVQE